MEKTHRKKMYGAAAALFALIIMCAAPAQSKISGEIGVKALGSDQTEGRLNVNREYQMLPRDASVSFLTLDVPIFHKQGGYFKLMGTNLGEGDVFTIVNGGLNRNLTYQGGYEKTPHNINLASGYFTYRDAENMRVNLYPLGKLNAILSYSNEDKSGRLNANMYVGQKTRTKAVDMNGALGDALLSFGISNQELQHSTVAHDMDGVSVTLTLKPEKTRRFNGRVSYKKREFDPNMNNAAGALEVKDTDLAAAFAVRKNLTLTSSLSFQDRSNGTAGAMSYDTDTIRLGVKLRSRLGRLAVNYKKADRDYTGASISNKETETFNLKGSTTMAFFGVRAEYEDSHRDVSGGTSATLWNFNWLPGETVKQNVSVNLLGFKKFSTTMYYNGNKQNYLPTATYGTTGTRSVVNGFSTVYMAEPNLDFTLDVSKLATRMIGRQRFYVSGVQSDYTLGVDSNTKYLSLGSHYYCSTGSMLTFGYSSASSNLSDMQNTNEVRERTISASLEKNLTGKHTLTAGISRTHYSDKLESDFSEKSTIFEIEILRKF